MAEILNRIIAIGGTTAHENPKTPNEIETGYIRGPEVISCVVAVQGGRVIGWQSTEHWKGEAHIGTFVNPDLQAKGAGAKMFAITCQMLKAAGIAQINASIRADNLPGLRYYARMGFIDFATDPDFALQSGQVVGRVHRRYDVA